jgi:hypothetical protein
VSRIISIIERAFSYWESGQYHASAKAKLHNFFFATSEPPFWKSSGLQPSPLRAAAPS